MSYLEQFNRIKAQKLADIPQDRNGRGMKAVREIELPKLQVAAPFLEPVDHRREMTQEDTDVMRERLNIPVLRELTTAHIDTPQEKAVMQNALDTARRWCDERKEQPGLSLVLMASPFGSDTARTGYGCGKTTIARALMFAASARVHWTGNPDTSSILTGSRFYPARELFGLVGEQHIGQIVSGNTPVLVIDDFGRERIGTLQYVAKESQEPERRTRSFQIIDYCYRKQIPLIITTNETVEDFRDLIGGASWSRLQQMAPAGYIVSLTGVRDYRPFAGGRASHRNGARSMT